MLNRDNNIKVDVHYIPLNYQNGLNLAGFHFKPRFIIEGILLAIICAVMFLMLFIKIPFLNAGSKIGFTLAFSALGFLLGCKGLSDEPISVFVLNYLRFKRRKRTAYYNPRVKLENLSFKQQLIEKDENKIINKIKKLFKKIRGRIEENHQQKTEQYQLNNYFNADKMFFIDDEGIIEKPTDFMDDKELNRYRKQEEDRQKRILSLAKQIERKERYKNG